jgi:hypothetical protein
MPKKGLSEGQWRERLQKFAAGTFEFHRGQWPARNSDRVRQGQAIERHPLHRNSSHLDPLGRRIVCKCGYHLIIPLSTHVSGIDSISFVRDLKQASVMKRSLCAINADPAIEGSNGLWSDQTRTLEAFYSSLTPLYNCMLTWAYRNRPVNLGILYNIIIAAIINAQEVIAESALSVNCQFQSRTHESMGGGTIGARSALILWQLVPPLLMSRFHSA